MADSDLEKLRDRMRKTIESSVADLSEEATESDFVAILANVGALKQLATQLVEVDRRTAALSRAGGAAAASRLDDLASTRTKLVEALQTLTREMGR